MLQSINTTAKKWIILPLFGLLILSFVAWGVADVFTGQTAQGTVLKAGDVELTGMHVQGEVQKNLDFIRRLTGKQVTMAEARNFGLIDRAINSLVTRALLEQEAARQGIVISDDVIMQSIRRIPDFQKPDGSFDVEKFKKALMNIGVSERLFVLDQRISLARDQMQDVVSSATYVPPLLQKAMAAAAAEKRTFETYQIRYDRQPVPATPDDTTLEAYVKENAAAFSAPEYRSISFLRLSSESLAGSVTITDEQAKNYYDTYPQEFTVAERRSFQQAVAPTKEIAEKLAADVKATKNFPAAARAADVSTAPLMDIVPEDLPEELRAIAFTLKTGEVSSPIETALGWHVLVPIKITPGRTDTFENALPAIRTQLKVQQAQEALYDETGRLDDMLAGGASLDEVGQGMNLTLENVASVDARGNDAEGRPVEQLKDEALLLQNAFAIPAGETSGVISLGGDRYAVVHVNSSTPAQLRPFASIKDKALAAWKAEQQQEAAQGEALKLLADLRGGMTMENAADAYKAEATKETDVVRGDKGIVRYIPAAATDDLFMLNEGEATQVPTEEGIVVVRFVSSTLPVAVADAKPDAQAVTELLEQLKVEREDAYVEGLKRRYTVRIDRDAIEKLFAEDDATN